jgi:hypothetical protein
MIKNESGISSARNNSLELKSIMVAEFRDERISETIKIKEVKRNREAKVISLKEFK